MHMLQQNIIDMGGRGRRTVARLERDRAAYLAAPNRCLACDAPILPHAGEKLSETLRRRFCTRSCAASYNNSRAVAPKKKAKPRTCADCGARIQAPAASEGSHPLCPACDDALLHRLPSLTRSEASGADIRRHMRQVLSDRPRACQHCGYATHVETVHLRPIDDVSTDAPLSQVNAPSNLAYLCPNHRWEYAHGLCALVLTAAVASDEEDSRRRPRSAETEHRRVNP